MPEPGDYGRPQDPRLRPPETPPQFQRNSPPRQDGTRPRQQQYAPRQDPQPAFTPGPRQGPPPPPGQYPPQPAWQQPYQPQYAPQPPQGPRKSRKGPLAFFGCGGLAAIFILIAILASHSSPSSSAPAAGDQPTQAAAPPAQTQAASAAAAQTVTYVVTGSDADVTYGPSGSDYSGSVPLHVSKPLGTPLYYSISAQLQGAGSVSCKIEVDGKTVSSSTASGGYNIAQCEISQDPLSGQWTDTNG